MAQNGLHGGTLYLDYNATTPVDPRVFNALSCFLEERFGNPSSKHALGYDAGKQVTEARCSVAKALGTSPKCIVFTSGATESINWALRSAAKLRRISGAAKPGRVVTCALEHPAVLRVCEHLRDEDGYELCLCRVSSSGLVDLSELKNLLTPCTVVVSIPFANGEIGAVQPMKEVVALVRSACPLALIHADASQAFGKVPVHPESLGVDLLTIAGHKVYAPKGIGALYIRESLQLPPLILGGGQERGLRGGTENVAFIIGLAQASELIHKSWQQPRVSSTHQDVVTAANLAAAHADSTKPRESSNPQLLHPTHLGFVARVFVEALWTALEGATKANRKKLSEWISINGPLGSEDFTVQQQWLPGTIHLSIKNADGVEVSQGLAKEEGMLISAGVSCHQGKSASGALVAMGISEEWAMGSLRISIGRPTSTHDAVQGAHKLAKYIVAHQLISEDQGGFT
ncbi:putative cysteine desulfurase [Cyclospora cayetanensis]|uniref:cysteine desulfurase n=1 Tax=Cyclospora cayetanensis TaxID=88456 RepID=A0A1D3CVS4_9EIME|nr:putative cysteine desulfurase [Cyclospora cayetanensis]